MNRFEFQARTRAVVRAAESTAEHARAALKDDPAAQADKGKMLSALLTPEGLHDGAERELADQNSRNFGLNDLTSVDNQNVVTSQIRVPREGDRHRIVLSWDDIRGSSGRAMSSVPGPKGGFLIGNEEVPPIDTMREFSVTRRLPVQTVTLTSGASIPTQAGGVTITWQSGEGSSITATDPTLGQLSLTPHTEIGVVDASLQLRQQAPQLGAFVFREVTRAIGNAYDQAVLNGTGGAQILGLLKQPTLTTVAGAALPWSGSASILKMRENIATANGDDLAVAWLAAPATRTVLANREVISTSGRTIWQNDLIDNRPAYVTTDVPAATLILGDWSRCLTAFWGNGIIVETNPSAGFNTGRVSLRVMLICDAIFLNIGAFSAATSVS